MPLGAVCSVRHDLVSGPPNADSPKEFTNTSLVSGPLAFADSTNVYSMASDSAPGVRTEPWTKIKRERYTYLRNNESKSPFKMCSRTESAQEIVNRNKMSRYTVYNYQWQAFGKGSSRMNKPEKQPDASQEKAEELRAEEEQLSGEKEDLDR